MITCTAMAENYRLENIRLYRLMPPGSQISSLFLRRAELLDAMDHNKTKTQRAWTIEKSISSVLTLFEL